MAEEQIGEISTNMLSGKLLQTAIGEVFIIIHIHQSLNKNLSILM